VCVGPLENNAYVVACARTGRAVVIDAAEEADRLEEACAGLQPVGILTTHGHHDHVGAAAELAARLGVTVRIHPADAVLAGLAHTAPISDGDTIGFGEARLEAVHVPGHTDGSVCFSAGKVVFTGDTLFPGGPGATGGDPERFATIMEGLRTRLFTLPDDTLVFPGHGLDTTIGEERPHLAGWQRRGW
jgi:glyoxylase-like metal-dependent hydrolase (beta-lactamase superfamily II)